jgi:uncharacterized OB-fold protein
MVAVREIGRTDVLDGRQNHPTRQTRGPGSHHRLPALRRGGMDQRPDVVHRRSFAPAPSNLDAAPPDLRGPIPTRDTVRVTVAVIFGPTTEDHAMQKALAPGISTWPDDIPCLIGSRCGSCGATAFPAQPRCPKCSAGDMSELLRPRRGTLVAWTTQGFLPGAPHKGPTGKAFVPLRCRAGRARRRHPRRGPPDRNNPAKLEFGMDVELTMVPFTTDDNGSEIVTFAFKPVRRGSRR